MHRLLVGMSDHEPETESAVWLASQGYPIQSRDLRVYGGKVAHGIDFEIQIRIWFSDVPVWVATHYVMKFGRDLRDTLGENDHISVAIRESLDQESG